MTGVVVTGHSCRRELGAHDAGRPGPTLLVLGGMHGNEPAGVIAVQRVLGALQARALPIAGRVQALAGNLGALAQGRRFVDRDLNRGWDARAIDAMLARPDAAAEDREQRELLLRFETAVRTARGPVVFVDLHTSSADGPPFLCLADTIDNRRLGLAARVPIILGIEETIDGASLEWFAERGIAAMAVEGGRHEHPQTVHNHEAVLWLVLEHLRMLPEGAVDTRPHRERLRAAADGVPAVVEIVHRHAIRPEHAFRMAPGFVNFQRVCAGELLAHDRAGAIRAPFACRVMLPLYQRLGDDGFFLGKRVRPVWLWLARWLRAAHLAAIAHWLPGVRRDPGDPLTLLVDRRIARWCVPQVFHLLGFRKVRPRGGELAFTRHR